MTDIQALSKNTLQVQFDDKNTTISTGDKLIFTSDFGRYEEGEEIVVEPQIGPNGEYVLKSWSETMALHYIGESLICEIISNDIAEIA
jgi:hypothetical protein